MEQLREVTGFVAHALLALYWAWTLSCTAPQLRKGLRDRGLRLRVLLVKSAGIVLTALLVAVIHFWATALWQVAVAVPVAAGLGYLLRREYRRLVHAPRHRLTLGARVRRTRAGTDPGIDLGPEKASPLRVGPLPVAPVSGEVVLPVADGAADEPVPELAEDADGVVTGVGRVPAPRGPGVLVALALPERGEHVPGQVPAVDPVVDAMPLDGIRRQSRVAPPGSPAPLRR